jgi:hypothetical protein
VHIHAGVDDAEIISQHSVSGPIEERERGRLTAGFRREHEPCCAADVDSTCVQGQPIGPVGAEHPDRPEIGMSEQAWRNVLRGLDVDGSPILSTFDACYRPVTESK